MDKQVISSSELNAMDNDDIALQLFYLIIKHGQRNAQDAIDIGKMIEVHGYAFRKKLEEKR